MKAPNEAMIVEQSRRFLLMREEFSRSHRFMAWFGGIGFCTLIGIFASGFVEKVQSSATPGVLLEGMAYGLITTLALGCFSIMAAGLILFTLRAKSDVDYIRHALLVKYHDALSTSSPTVISTPKNNP